MNSKYSYLIWDYNGTIVDDAALAVEAENVVLKKCGLPLLTLDYYLQECEMPIINFYKKIYDFSIYNFEDVAASFLYNYDLLSPKALPFPEVCEAIQKYASLGFHQGVISGFETGRLEKSLEKFGLTKYFNFMSGADDTSCGSKSERAAEVIKKYGYDPQKTLFIGDMYHDYETACHVGSDCVLIAKGHQGANVLRAYGTVPVIDSASQLAHIIL